MAPSNGPSEAERHQREVCNAFARAAVAMRDAAQTAENFSNWFSRVNDVKNAPIPTFFASAPVNFSMYGGPQQQPYLSTSPVAADSADTKTAKKRKADEEAVEEGGKKKRVTKEKKIRDKNAPKRPPSAYLMFQNDVRKDVKAANPQLANNELLREIAKMWGEVPPEDKQAYEDGRQNMKIKYEIAKAQYDAEHPNGVILEAAEPKATKPGAKVKPKKAEAEVSTPAEPVAASEEEHEESDEVHSDKDSSSDDGGGGDKDESDSKDAVEDDEEDEESEPEPPRKKPKKVPTPTPPPVKVTEKKKRKSSNGEEKGKSKKKKKDA